jgi:hypothetical protein
MCRREVIRAIAAYGTGINLRGALLARTVLEASSSEPALREHWDALERHRLTGTRRFVARVAELGPLRAGRWMIFPGLMGICMMFPRSVEARPKRIDQPDSGGLDGWRGGP